MHQNNDNTRKALRERLPPPRQLINFINLINICLFDIDDLLK